MVTQTTHATPASQTITFTTNAPSSAAYNSQFTVAATASSGLAVTFTSSGSCSNSGATYTMTSGSGTCSVIANQAGNSNNSAAPMVTQTTNATKITPTITWPNPANIIYGTVLGSTQLDASSAVAGSFAYTPASNTILRPGSGQTLSVTFTPADTADYTTVTKTVQINVLFRTGVACTNGLMSGVILQPVNADGSSVFKMGSTVPTKFAVCDVNNNSIGPNSAFPNSSVVAGYILAGATSSTATGVDEDVYSNTPDQAFRWDSTAQQWIFNQATGKSTNLNAAPATYLFQIRLIDGTILGVVPTVNNAGVPNFFGAQPGFQYGLR